MKLWYDYDTVFVFTLVRERTSLLQKCPTTTMEAKPGRISNRHVSITGHAVEAKDMSSDVIVIGSFSLMHSVISNKISVKLSETENRVQGSCVPQRDRSQQE